MTRKLLFPLILLTMVLSGILFWCPPSSSRHIAAWCSDQGILEESPNYSDISKALQTIDRFSSVQFSISSNRGELSRPGVLVSSRLSGSGNVFDIVVRKNRSVFIDVSSRTPGVPILFEVGTFPTDSINQKLDFGIKNGTVLHSLMNGQSETSIDFSPLNPFIDLGHISGSRLIISNNEVKICISAESRTFAATLIDLVSRALFATTLFLIIVLFSLKLQGLKPFSSHLQVWFKSLAKFFDTISSLRILLLTALSLLILVLPNFSRLTPTQDLNISIPTVNNPSSHSPPYIQTDRFKNRTKLQVRAELSSLRDLEKSTEIIVLGYSSGTQRKIAKFSFNLEGVRRNELILTIELASDLPAFNYSGATFRSKVPNERGLVLLEVSENRRVTASQGDRQFFSYSFGRSVFNTEDASHISVINNQNGSVNARLHGLATNGMKDFLLILKTWISVLLFLICLGVFSQRLRNQIFRQGLTPITTSSASAAILGSSIVTIFTFILSKLFSSGRTFYSENGLQLSAFAQFSDFHELSRISQVELPYSLLHSNYPPFAIAIFRLGVTVFSTNALWLGLAVALVPGVLVSLTLFSSRPRIAIASVLALTVFCYPVLFALDRGNPDLIMPLLILAFLISLILERPKLAAGLLGIAIAFKIYPIVFLLLFLRRKNSFSNISICGLSVLIATLLASVFLREPGLSEIPKYLVELRSQNELMNVQPFLSGFNSSMTAWWHSLEYFLKGDIGFAMRFNDLARTVTLIVSACLFLSIGFWSVAKKRPISLVYLIALQTILLVIDLSADYRLGLFIPAILLLVVDFENRLISQRTSLCCLMVVFFFLSSHPVFFLLNTPLSVGHLFNAPVLLVATLLIPSMHYFDSKLDGRPHPLGIPEH